jgi:hypothetical protein
LIRALADLNLPKAAIAKSPVPGVGMDRLRRFQDRARLLLTPGAQPYARKPLGLARAARELHFDIEADPSRDNLIYLHWILDRRIGPAGQTEEFVHFFADGPTGKRDAFASTMDYLTTDPSARIYYYSKYERTAFKLLQSRYPEVCTAADAAARAAAHMREVDVHAVTIDLNHQALDGPYSVGVEFGIWGPRPLPRDRRPADRRRRRSRHGAQCGNGRPRGRGRRDARARRRWPDRGAWREPSSIRHRRARRRC